MAVTGGSAISLARQARAGRARADAALFDAAVALYQESLASGLDSRLATASAAEEIRLGLRVEKWYGEQLVTRAVRMHSLLPQLMQAMRDGLVVDFDARVVCEVLDDYEPSAVEAVAAAVDDGLSQALRDGRRPFDLRRSVRGRADRAARGARLARRARAATERFISFRPGPDGMAYVSGMISDLDAAMNDALLTALAAARKAQGDPRSVTQLKADVFCERLQGAAGCVGSDDTSTTSDDRFGRGNRGGDVRARVNVHVPVDALLRIDPHGSASLDGYGEVPREMVDYLLSQAGTPLRAVLCDPDTGRPVALGRTRRLFPAQVRELARVRDRECLIPGCHTPPARCDTDHLLGWRRDGQTNPDNASARCAFHNRTLKTIAGWAEHRDPHTGAITLTTPAGQRHTYQPRTILNPPIFNPPIHNERSALPRAG